MRPYQQMTTDELWAELIRLARVYTMRRYGRRADAVSLHCREWLHREPFPEETPEPAASGWKVRLWNSGPAPQHLTGFRAVYWPGLDPATFYFSESQAAVVARLWAAWQSGVPEVPGDELLGAAGSEGSRLADLFKGHPAWGALIRVRRSHYRLPVLEEDAGAA